MTPAQKIIKYLAMAFAIFLSVSIISGICGAALSVSYFFGGRSDGEMINHTLRGKFTTLKIDLSAAELEIKTGSEFHFETNHKYITCRESNNSLEIRETKPFFAARSGGIKAILTMPEETVLEYTDISTGAARVIIDELLTNSLKISLGAGEFKAKRIVASSKAKIDGGAGSLTVSDGFLRDADIDMGAGELNLTSRLEGESRIDYGVGATELTLIGEKEDYKIKLDKGIGEAWLENIKMSDDSVYGSGNSYIKIDGGIGNLNITFRPQAF